MGEKELKELHTFILDNGFIWGPSPEIYGGCSGFYEYGPLGKLLKNKVEDAIRKVFTNSEFWEVECPTVMPSVVWKASGHLGGFTDPLIRCSKCRSEFRVDKIIEDRNQDLSVGGLSDADLLGKIDEMGIKCTSCGAELDKKILQHSLMMKTTIGTDAEAYNRPETATTTYLPFRRYDDFFRQKYPYGVFQIGKAYRNEISPRQSVMRGREFTQAEAQLFLFADQKNNFERFEKVKDKKLPLWFKDASGPVMTSLGDAIKNKKLNNQAYAWTLALAYDLFVAMGIPAEKMRMRQHADDEKAFYADDAWDVEVQLNSYGWYEVCGIHDRTDYDLIQHSNESKQKLETFNESAKRKEVPHVLEIAFGTDRPTYSLLDIFYDSSDNEHRVFRIPYDLAPVEVAVMPLVNKVKAEAEELFESIKGNFICRYDSSGSIGRRYYRQDEAGTPVCVTVDFQTKEDGTVTLRNRDDGKQVRVNKDEVAQKVRALLNGEAVEKLGTLVEEK